MFRITLKSLLGHKLRFALTVASVTLGVAFVVGAFVLTDSVKAQFGTLFSEINSGIDLQVRGRERFDTGQFGGNTGPKVPEATLDDVRDVDGVAAADGTVGGFPIWVIDTEGEVVRPTGGPPLGFNWTEDRELGTLTMVEGEPPTADDQMVIDEDTATEAGYDVGDTVQVDTPLGPAEYTLSGIVRFGDNNALVGATLTAFTTAEAQRLFNFEGAFATIDVRVEEGADRDAVQAAISQVVPSDTEVVDIDVVTADNEESVGQFIDIFLNVLLGFAFIILFVSMFLIYNTFRIVIGQRVRELALLRAVGAGTRQVFASVIGEALIIGIVSSILGFGLGVLIAIGMNALLNSAGFGTGESSLVIEVAPFVYALAVGVIVTFLSSLLPAWQSTRVPPAAAVREGFSLDTGSLKVRLIVGIAALVLGILSIASALFGSAEGVAVLGGMAVGSVLVFLGVAGLSPTFAAPITRFLGAPFRVFRVTGQLAVENGARNPRRTSATAAALMIGLALVTMALVVGTSIKTSFADALESSIKADWYVDSGSFVGFSPTIAEQLREQPELAAVSQGRFGAMQVGTSTKQFSAVDYATIEDMFELDIVDGEVEPGAQGILVGVDPAEDLGLQAGDLVDVEFNETGVQSVPVVAVFDETAILGNWVIDIETYEANFTERLDYFLAATTAEGVAQGDARAAIEETIAASPALSVKDREEFKSDQLGILDGVLVVVNVFLLFAILIAGFGIANTLALSVFERTREIGLLRAVGQTKNQVRTMITFEAILVAVFGAVLGIVVGVGFGLATANALPDDFVSSLDIPLGSLIGVLILAIILGTVASLYPAWRASRLNILEAIAFE
jgi:putative ABC transport system permease protein